MVKTFSTKLCLIINEEYFTYTTLLETRQLRNIKGSGIARADLYIAYDLKSCMIMELAVNEIGGITHP